MSKFSWIVLFFLLSFYTQAQHLAGISMGNYAGTNALYHNPANVTDSRYSVFGNLVGSQIYIGNNHLKYDAPFSAVALFSNQVGDEYRYKNNGKINFKRSYLEENLNGNTKFLNASAEVRLPSIMFGLFKGKMGVGLTTRARVIGNFSNISEPIARLITNNAGFPELHNQVHVNQNANVHLNGFGEIGLTIGGTLLDNETDFIKVGFTVKRLVGVYNSYIQVENSSYQVKPAKIFLNRESGLVQIDEIHVKYGTTRNDGLKNFQFTPQWIFGDASPGSGWAMDLGAVYEYRPDINKYTYTEKGKRIYDNTKNKYLYRISASLIDIGRINFRNPYYLLQNEIHTTNKQLSTLSFLNSKTFEEIYYDINKELDAPVTSLAPSKTSIMPASFQVSVDYALQKNVYINGLWVQNLIGPKAFGMKAESSLTITPRYEHRFYELSLPLSLMNRYRSPSIGIAGRVGPFWIGTDHIFGLMNVGKPRAMNVYFGVSAGIFRKKPKDSIPCWPLKKPLFQRIFSKQ